MKRSLLIILSTILISSVYSQSWNHIQFEYPDSASYTSFGTGLAMDSAYTIVGAPRDLGSNIGTVSFYKNNYILDSIILKQKLINPSQSQFGKFGSSVSISGNYAVVGNRFESLDSIGQNSLASAGAAYVYKLTAGVWSLQQKIVAADRAMNLGFGYSVAISDERILIGMAYTGDVYSFLMDTNGVWYQSQKFNLIYSVRSSSVAIDGVNAVIGIYLMHDTTNNTVPGGAYLYKFDTAIDSFLLQETIHPTDGGYFGKSVSIKNNKIIIGAPRDSQDSNSTNYIIRAGAAYIYSFDANYNVSLIQKITAPVRKANAEFGSSVSIYNDICTVGAPKDSSYTSSMGGTYSRGKAYIYKDSLNNWNNIKTKSGAYDNSRFGSSVAINNRFQIVASLPNDLAHYFVPDGFLDVFKQQLTQTSVRDTTYYVGCNSYTDSNGVYYAESVFYLDTMVYFATSNYHYYDINIISPIAQITVNEACPPVYISPSENYLWNTDGIYYDTIFRPTQSCDSIIRVDLSFDFVDVAVVKSGDSIIASSNSNIASYQWLNCSNYSAITNATSNTFKPLEDGGFAVKIQTVASCVDTSICLQFVSIVDDTTYYVGCNSYTDSNGIYYAESVFYLDTAKFLTSGNYYYYDINVISPIAHISANDACPPTYTSPSGNYLWNTDGIYYDTIFRPTQSCDSIIKVDLSFDFVDVDVVKSGDSIIASNSSNIASYQWLNCSNYSIIANATSNTFKPLEDGKFAVKIQTLASCIDTSVCVLFDVKDKSDYFAQQIKLYPNPSQEIINIDFTDMQKHIILSVENMLGANVIEQEYNNVKSIKLNQKLSNGIYILKLLSQNGDTAIFKVVVE